MIAETGVGEGAAVGAGIDLGVESVVGRDSACLVDIGLLVVGRDGL